MNELAIILADVEDVIGIIVFFVVALAVWFFQTVGKMLQKGRPQHPARPGQGGRAQGGLQEEIGEFLRKAAQGQRRPQQQPPPPVPERPQPGQRAVRAEVGGRQQPARADLALQRARQAAEAARQRARARHGTGSTSPQPPSRPSPEPQQAVARSKRQAAVVDAAIVVEPETESLHTALTGAAAATGRPESAASPSGAVAAGIHAMLSNPQNLRQAIILSEILNRPTDRW